MSIKAISWAFGVETGSSSSKLVLLKLADNANDEGYCFPSHRYIAEHCEMSRETVNRHIKKLADMGLIQVEHRSKDGVNLPNAYYLNVGANPTGVASHDHRGGLTQSQGVASQDHTESSVRTVSEPSPPCGPPKGDDQTKNGKKRKPTTPPPDDFEVTDKMWEWARGKGIPDQVVRRETEQFLNHHRAKDSRFRDWQMAWRTWLTNWLKWEGDKQQPSGPKLQEL